MSALLLSRGCLLIDDSGFVDLVARVGGSRQAQGVAGGSRLPATTHGRTSYTPLQFALGLPVLHAGSGERAPAGGAPPPTSLRLAASPGGDSRRARTYSERSSCPWHAGHSPYRSRRQTVLR